MSQKFTKEFLRAAAGSSGRPKSDYSSSDSSWQFSPRLRQLFIENCDATDFSFLNFNTNSQLEINIRNLHSASMSSSETSCPTGGYVSAKDLLKPFGGPLGALSVPTRLTC